MADRWSARTVGHAHRVLHRALQMAVATEVLMRNVASAISPPTVKEEEIEILTDDQITMVIDGLAGHDLHAIAVAMRLSSSLRRRSRSTATALGGSEIVRLPHSVFGGLNRMPVLVSSSDRSTRTVAQSRSTSQSKFSPAKAGREVDDETSASTNMTLDRRHQFLVAVDNDDLRLALASPMPTPCYSVRWTARPEDQTS